MVSKEKDVSLLDKELREEILPILKFYKANIKQL